MGLSKSRILPSILLLISLACISTKVCWAAANEVQPWLGVEVDPAISGGVGVKRVIPSAPAEKAGFQANDLIQAIDKTPVKTREELMQVLRDKGVGSKVTVHILREKKAMTKELKLEMLPNMLDLAKAQLVNKPAPAFELTDVNSKKVVHNADYQGRVYVLEFWATWCPACRAAAPYLASWARIHKEIPIIGVSDEEPAAIAAFVKKENIPYLETHDQDAKVQSVYGMGSIPAFILVDKSGQVKDLTVGVGEYLETLLKEAEGLAAAKG